MQIIYQLALKLPCYFSKSLKLNTYFTVTKEIVKEIMLQLYTMINHHDMLFSFVRNIVFFQKHFKCILIDFFLKSTA